MHAIKYLQKRQLGPHHTPVYNHTNYLVISKLYCLSWVKSFNLPHCAGFWPYCDCLELSVIHLESLMIKQVFQERQFFQLDIEFVLE